MVTTTADDVANQLKTVELLIEARPDFPHAVKDSFNNLDLDQLGLMQLLDAQWYARAPASVPGNLQGKAGHWQCLSTEPELVAWEKAWRAAGDHENILKTPMFPAQLLNEPGVIFLASKNANTITAGAIAYEASGVIGITNFFSKPNDSTSQFAACLNILHTGNPEATIVGYEREHTLSEYSGLNLQPLGPCVFG